MKDMVYYTGPPIMRGSGLGSLFRGLMKAVVPAVGKIARSSVVRKGARSLTKHAIGAVGDMIAGQNPKQALKNRARAGGLEAIDHLLNKNNKKGRKHAKRISRGKVSARKRPKRDIF